MPSSAPEIRDTTQERGPLPTTVAIAAALLALYGIAVLVNAFIDQTALGWNQVHWRGFPRSAIRCGGMLVTAWGLTVRARWAWWVGVCFGGILSLAGLLGAPVLWLIREEVRLPTRVIAVGLTSLAAVIVAVALLLTPSARSAFKRSTS